MTQTVNSPVIIVPPEGEVVIGVNNNFVLTQMLPSSSFYVPPSAPNTPKELSSKPDWQKTSIIFSSPFFPLLFMCFKLALAPLILLFVAPYRI